MSPKNTSTPNTEAAKPALVPKLRFPEFQGAGGWTTEKLGTVATISSTKVGNNVCVPMSITSGVGLVSQEDKFGRVIAGESYKNYLLLNPPRVCLQQERHQGISRRFPHTLHGQRVGCSTEQYLHLLPDQWRVTRCEVSQLPVLRQPAWPLVAQVYSGRSSGAWLFEHQR